MIAPAQPVSASADISPESPAPVEATIKTLIVDDQLIAREVLRHMLKREPDIELIGTCTNGLEAVESIYRLQPDLVFLDVQMPELDGFGVLKEVELSRRPVVIVVTANEEFALKAFDAQVLDFLVKPFERDRLQRAVQRARATIRQTRDGELHKRLSDIFSRGLRLRPRELSRLPIRSNGRIILVPTAKIDWIESAGAGAKLHFGDDFQDTTESLESVEEKLPSDFFLRINASTIVNAGCIRELQPTLDGACSVILQNDRRLTLTPEYRDQLCRVGVVV